MTRETKALLQSSDAPWSAAACHEAKGVVGESCWEGTPCGGACSCCCYIAHLCVYVGCTRVCVCACVYVCVYVRVRVC